jgi:hypothetical protein
MAEPARAHWAIRIPDDTVRAMRAAYKTGATVSAIFVKYGHPLGVSFDQVRRIVYGTSRKDVK